MKDHEVPFKNASKDEKSPLVDKLLEYGPEFLKARSISIVINARNRHQKIPYADIGEALRLIASDLSNEQLGKIFLKGNL